NFQAYPITKGHTRQCFRQATGAHRVGSQDLATCGGLREGCPVLLQRRKVRGEVLLPAVRQPYHAAACLLEFGCEDLICRQRAYREGHERWRHVEIIERAAHGVLATDSRSFELKLGLECAKHRWSPHQPKRGDAVYLREERLQGKAGARAIATTCHDAGDGFNNGVASAVKWAPRGDLRFETEAHQRGGAALAFKHGHHC